MKRLLQISFVFLTTLAFLVAVFITLIRIGCAISSSFLDDVNDRVSEYDIQLEDLKVSLSRFNPVIEINQMNGLTVSATGIVGEIDTIRSLTQNRFVFSSLQFDSVTIETNSRSCDSLLVGDSNANGGLWLTLRNSSHLDIPFTSSIACEGKTFNHEGVIRTLRVDGELRAELRLKERHSCDDCGAIIRFQEERLRVFSRSFNRVVQADVTDLVVPLELFGLGFLEPIVLNASASGAGRNVELQFDAEFDITNQTDIEESAPLTGTVEASLSRGQIYGQLWDVRLGSEGEYYFLSNQSILLDLNSSKMLGWGGTGDVELIQKVIDQFGDSTHSITQWITQLSPSGHLDAVSWLKDGQGLTYTADISDISLQQHSGVPGLEMEMVRVFGFNNAVWFKAIPQRINFELSSVFQTPKDLILRSETDLLLTFGRRSIGLALIADEFSVSGADLVCGIEFGFRLEYESKDASFGMKLNVADASIESVKSNMPSLVPDGVFRWIDESIEQVELDSGNLSLVIQRDGPTSTHTTHFSSHLFFDQARVEYHPLWPVISEGKGEIRVTHKQTEVLVEQATYKQIQFQSGRVGIPYGDDTVELDFEANGLLSSFLDYLEAAPLEEVLPLDSNIVASEGSADLTAELLIPLDSDKDFFARFGLTFDDNQLDFFDQIVVLDDVNGTINFESPNKVSSTGLFASILGSEVQVELTTSEQVPLSFAFESRATPGLISHYIGDWSAQFLSGQSTVTGELTFPAGEHARPALILESDLAGLEVDLPHPIGKTSDEMRPTIVAIEYADPLKVDFDSGLIEAKFERASDGVLKGSVGLNSTPVEIASAEAQWNVTGSLSKLSMGGGSGQLSIPTGFSIQFHDFSLDLLEHPRFDLHDLVINGGLGLEDNPLKVKAQELDARAYKRKENERWVVRLERINLVEKENEKQDEDEQTDSEQPADLSWLPPIDLFIDEFTIVDIEEKTEDFGVWSMRLDVVDNHLQATTLFGAMRGVQIDAREEGGIVWDTQANRSSFVGVLSGEDLAEILPEFDLDSAIESEDFTMNVDLSWAGHPMKFDTMSLQGNLQGDINNGNFPDTDAAGRALRLTSLLNIAPIIQQLKLDFRSVFGRGMYFERILYDVDLDKSRIIIEEPIHVKARSSEIRFNGIIDMETQALDNEVVVELPLRENLGWYAGIISGNPQVFLGTWLGSTIFKPQLEKLSSAKYSVSGTLDAPEIAFVGQIQDELSANDVDGDTEETTTPPEQGD